MGLRFIHFSYKYANQGAVHNRIATYVTVATRLAADMASKGGTD